MLVIIFFFSLAIFLNNFFIASVMGFSYIPVFILFLMGLIVYFDNFKHSILSGIVCAVLFELASGFDIGLILFPYIIAALMYYWIKNFIDLKSIRNDIGIKNLLFDTLLLSSMNYFFEFVYFLLISKYDFIDAYQSWRVIVDITPILYTLMSAFFWAMLFRKFTKRAY